MVYIQQVYGTWAANGLRRVSGASQTTFQITDINDNPIAGNGNYIFSGFVGKVEPHVIKPHPRLMFDGPDGQITAAMDGSAGKSSRATSSSPAYQALESLNNAKQAQSTATSWGPYTYLKAMGWFMDRTKTAWLDSAKYAINNIEKVLAPGTTSGTFTPGLFSASAYGRGSDTDWASHESVPHMYAYSLIRDQLTQQERQMFADKILNNSTDNGEACTPPLVWLPGTLNYTAGSTSLTGTGMDFTTIPAGTVIATLLPHQKAYNQPFSWGMRPAITSASEMTLTTASTVTVSGVRVAMPRAWAPGDCGWRWYVRNHSYSPMYDRRKLGLALSASVDSAATTIPVVVLPPKTPPYYIMGEQVIAGKYVAEYMKVTAHAGNNLIVERGYLNTTPH